MPSFLIIFYKAFFHLHVDEEAEEVCSLYTEFELSRLDNFPSVSHSYHSRSTGFSQHLLNAPPESLPLKYFAHFRLAVSKVSVANSETFFRVGPISSLTDTVQRPGRVKKHSWQSDTLEFRTVSTC